MKNISESDYKKLLRGEIVFSGGKGFAICAKCNRMISVTGFFGSVHICTEAK